MGRRYVVLMGCLMASVSIQMMGASSGAADRATLEKMLDELAQQNTQLKEALESVKIASVQGSAAQGLHQLGSQIDAHHALVQDLAKIHGVVDSQKEDEHDAADDGYDEDGTTNT